MYPFMGGRVRVDPIDTIEAEQAGCDKAHGPKSFPQLAVGLIYHASRASCTSSRCDRKEVACFRVTSDFT